MLVEPEPRFLGEMLLAGRSVLPAGRARLLDQDLTAIRHETRLRLIGADAQRPLVVIGHQPEFIHPGVWAKHVVARRLARAVDGVSVNLVVDGDVPKRTVLTVPTDRGGEVELRRVGFDGPAPGVVYERMPALNAPAIDRFGEQTMNLMGDRFAASLMPAFLDGLRGAPAGADFVDQTISGRAAVDRLFGVEMRELRISRTWGVELLADMIAQADRFRAAYNHALADYRRDHRIRGTQRPVPDLMADGGRCELPVWVLGKDGRRRRLLVESRGGGVSLFADAELLGRIDAARVGQGRFAGPEIEGLGDVAFRPRALTLTLWARLLLADLFIHGIGGAKYDRITDALIRGYFGIEPPPLACVSATLHLLARDDGDFPGEWTRARRDWRDLRYNPQRHVPAGPENAALFAQRSRAVERSTWLRDHEPRRRDDRREVFRVIRSLNERILDRHPGVLAEARGRIQSLEARLARNRMAGARDAFFALFDKSALERLCDALPQERDFAL